MAENKPRILLIGEQPDLEVFAMLGGAGFELVSVESCRRARDIFPLYKPHCVILFLRYTNEIALLQDCVTMAGSVPVVAAISLLAKPALVKAVKEKAAAFFVLPEKPQTIKDTLRGLVESRDNERLASEAKNGRTAYHYAG